MRIATLACWALTVSLGGYMLRGWLVSGGWRRREGLPPQLIFGHMGLALTGLALWIAYTASGARTLCWAAVLVLTGVIALGICTVTLWTPYPARTDVRDRPPSRTPSPRSATAGEAGFTLTDEMIEQFLDDPFPQTRGGSGQFAAIIPVAHGIGAIATFVLAVMTASMTA
jgi:hypothetical protein